MKDDVEDLTSREEDGVGQHAREVPGTIATLQALQKLDLGV